MPKIESHQKVSDGWLIGTVRTNRVGSECEFAICSVEEWEKLTDDEGEKLATEAMNESGQMEWYY